MKLVVGRSAGKNETSALRDVKVLMGGNVLKLDENDFLNYCDHRFRHRRIAETSFPNHTVDVIDAVVKDRADYSAILDLSAKVARMRQARGLQ